MRAGTLELVVDQGGTATPVRVERDSEGELHLGSRDATSHLEQLLVYDLGDDVHACTRLMDELRAVATGSMEPLVRAWNINRLSIDSPVSTLRLMIEGADEPLQIDTRELHGAIHRFREFLEATSS